MGMHCLETLCRTRAVLRFTSHLLRVDLRATGAVFGAVTWLYHVAVSRGCTSGLACACLANTPLSWESHPSLSPPTSSCCTVWAHATPASQPRLRCCPRLRWGQPCGRAWPHCCPVSAASQAGGGPAYQALGYSTRVRPVAGSSCGCPGSYARETSLRLSLASPLPCRLLSCYFGCCCCCFCVFSPRCNVAVVAAETPAFARY